MNVGVYQTFVDQGYEQVDLFRLILHCLLVGIWVSRVRVFPAAYQGSDLTFPDRVVACGSVLNPFIDRP